MAPVDPHQPSFQVHRLHRDPDAPRGNPGRLGHPGDALLAAAHHADDVHEVSSSNPLQNSNKPILNNVMLPFEVETWHLIRETSG